MADEESDSSSTEDEYGPDGNGEERGTPQSAQGSRRPDYQRVNFFPEGAKNPAGKVAAAEMPVDPLKDVKWPREVGIGFKVENIMKVDTLNSTFTALFKLSLEWELTDAEYELWLENHWAASGRRPPWEPLLDLPTAHKVEMRQELPIPYANDGTVFDIFEHAGRHFTVVYLRYRCVFGECYELQNFPFDCQDLSLVLISLDRTKAILRPRFKRKDFAVINTENFTIAEWELHPPVANFTLNKSSDASRSGQQKSEFIFQVKLKRRYHFYVHRIVILAGSLTCSSMLSWCIDLDRPHRLMLCFTILLTLVAFQLATANKLPQVRYFTLLDYYVVACQRFMMLVALQHGLLAKWVKEEWVDDLCGFLTVIVYVIMQLIWVIVAVRQSRLEDQKLKLSHEELKEWLASRRQMQSPSALAQSSQQLFKLNSRVYQEDQYGLMTFNAFGSTRSDAEGSKEM
mmetsp:Transcript_42271/g.99263  ORF Transcript_42271/g.99263 Transcript_42271/m.99263 type:complete len:457 (+) Transcript_42271:111-1481(+)